MGGCTGRGGRERDLHDSLGQRLSGQRDNPVPSGIRRPPGRGGAVVAVEHREQTASADVSRGNLMLRLAHDGTGMTADALPMVNGKTVPHACSQRNARMTSIQTRTATRAIRVVRSPRNVRTRVRRLAHSPSPAPGKAPRTKATAGPKGI